MKLIVDARVEDPDGNVGAPIVLGTFRRRDGHLADIGMSLAEGRSLLGRVQSALVSQQVGQWQALHATCGRCGQALAHKDSRSIVMRTAFGEIAVPSPRFWAAGRAWDFKWPIDRQLHGAEIRSTYVADGSIPGLPHRHL